MSLCRACQIDTGMVRCTVNERGQHHSFNDEPAQEYNDNGSLSMFWLKNGKYHRDGGAAIQYRDTQDKSYIDDFWFLDGREATPILQEDLHPEKVISVKGVTAVVIKQITNSFWEVLQGDKKKLVYVLDEA